MLAGDGVIFFLPIIRIYTLAILLLTLINRKRIRNRDHFLIIGLTLSLSALFIAGVSGANLYYPISYLFVVFSVYLISQISFLSDARDSILYLSFTLCILSILEFTNVIRWTDYLDFLREEAASTYVFNSIFSRVQFLSAEPTNFAIFLIFMGQLALLKKNLIAFLFCTTALVLTFSSAGLIILLAGCLLNVMYFSKIPNRILGLVLITIFSLVLYQLMGDVEIVKKIIQISNSHRMESLIAGVKLLSGEWFLGLGFGYLAQAKINILQWYVHVIIEAGVVGCLFVVYYLFYSVKYVKKSKMFLCGAALVIFPLSSPVIFTPGIVLSLALARAEYYKVTNDNKY